MAPPFFSKRSRQKLSLKKSGRRINFLAKMQEQQKRYTKYDDTAYYLEPNIKEGPGGLRDLHVIAWVFKRQYDTSTLKN